MNIRFRFPLALLAFIVASSPLLAQPGTSGLAFLTLGASGRSVAMGDAMTSIVTGASATHANPAGLLGAPGIEPYGDLVFMHREWFQDTRSEFLAGLIPIDNENAVGAMVSTTTVSDIEVRLRPGPADGTFTSRDFAAGLSYARRIAGDLRVGVTGKFLYQKIYVDEATGFAADIGAVWESPVENLTVGGVIANLGSMNALREETTKLPALLRVGPGYKMILPGGELAVVGAMEYVRILPENRNQMNIGGELTFRELLAARAGYQFGAGARGLTLGVGIHYGIVSLDYAFAKIAADLGDGHAFSLSLRL